MEDESGFDPEYVQEGAQTTSAPDGTEQRLQEGLNERLDVSGLKNYRTTVSIQLPRSSSLRRERSVFRAVQIDGFGGPANHVGEDSGTVPVSDQKQQYQWTYQWISGCGWRCF